jgi:hypothetical protein
MAPHFWEQVATMEMRCQMSDENEFHRLRIKSPEQKFLQILTQEYRYSPRVAEALLGEAQTCLMGKSEQMRPGQMRTMLAGL